MFAAAARIRSSLREQRATRAPSFTISEPMAKPNPAEAPNTRARLPFKPKSIRVFLHERNEPLADEPGSALQIHLLRAGETLGQLGHNPSGDRAHLVSQAIRHAAEAHQSI